ncbi:hypothetical protein [Paenibacillus odorifer]|nr:hypothetical protein [Paenibacillus odorifer]
MIQILLEMLFSLVETEKIRELTQEETEIYIKIVEHCHSNEIEIPFGIEL